jgi:hypothetical protein
MTAGVVFRSNALPAVEAFGGETESRLAYL